LLSYVNRAGKHFVTPYTPGFQTKPFFEELDFASNTVPSFTFLNMFPQTDPAPEGHLDGISSSSFFKELNYRFEEECGVHSEIQSIGFSQSCVNLSKDPSKEPKAGLAIMDVTGAVPYPKNMACLSDVGHDGIVTGYSTLMRVVPPQSTRDVLPCREHGTIDIQGQGTERQLSDHSGYDLSIQGLKPLVGFTGKTLQPSAQRPWARKTSQSTESFENRIPIQIQNMAKSLGAHDDEAQKYPNHTGYTEIAYQACTVHIGSDQPIEFDDSEIAYQQLQTGIGREVTLGKGKTKITIDTALNLCFPSSHCMWPFVVVLLFLSIAFIPQRKAFF
jgi:hypothetical protein